MSIPKESKNALILGALGVVFGDIGTSPLYAFKECLSAFGSGVDSIMGILSLIAWTLFLVTSVKYVGFILRADNAGEGGIFALLSGVQLHEKKIPARTMQILLWMTLLGAGFMYGDGILTPAISVLSAIEGITLRQKNLSPYVVPTVCGILIFLFGFQKKGTDKIGKFFGPICLVWFTVLAALGIYRILERPEILQALSPVYAFNFFATHQFGGLVVLASVFLVVTGAEALYADLGHFGVSPIRTGWLALVFPSLLLNYFGQGANLLNHPDGVSSPFYNMVPEILLYPLCALAAMATIIASQALITACFSLTQQAVQLGFLPWVRVKHTGEHHQGQIYIGLINIWLLLGCLALVVCFKTSSHLAHAYGLAISITMVITTILFYYFAVHVWNWGKIRAGLLSGIFLCFEIPFFVANLSKILEGGYIPLLIAGGILLIMLTWREGNQALDCLSARRSVDLDFFIKMVKENGLARPARTAVFPLSMGIPTEVTPRALLQYCSHTHTVPEQVIVVRLNFLKTPYATEKQAMMVENLGSGFYRVQVNCGYIEEPNLENAMKGLSAFGLKTKDHSISYYWEQELIVDKKKVKMNYWRKILFGFMLRSNSLKYMYLGIPSHRALIGSIPTEM